MPGPVYEQLAEALRSRGGAVPVLKCREFYALVEELFTPEEAEMAAKMPLSFFTAEAFAGEIPGADPKDAERFLETMANKGLVFSDEIGGVRHYALLPLFPGIFEMQLMKGEVNDRTKKIARLIQDYYEVIYGLREGTAPALPAFPFARVITVEQEIPAGVEVYTYDKASQYIANSDYIVLALCYCRLLGELLGRPCDKPKDVCLAFGPSAKYIAGRGFGRLISKEEALKILDRAEKAGLIHCSSNTSEQIDFICNCCVCHCAIFRGIKNAAVPRQGASSGFIVVVDEEKCMGCGDCIDRCQMEALSMQNDIVARDANRCIGCGLCISVCPTLALRMEPREQRPTPPRDRVELGMALLSSLPSQQDKQ